MSRVLIAGDWHLGTYSAPGETRLVLAFLRGARDARPRRIAEQEADPRVAARVVGNGERKIHINF